MGFDNEKNERFHENSKKICFDIESKGHLQRRILPFIYLLINTIIMLVLNMLTSY
jgi:hypothetical protein